MIEFLQTVLALVVTISILVTIHEFGHYWVARLCGVHVLRFSIGFGKSLYMKRGPAPVNTSLPENSEVEIRTRSNEPLEGTEFAIAAIPLGGYVKMLDEREGYVPDDLKHMAFNRKSVWQRIAIVSAGPAANFLLAIALYWVLFVVGVTGVAPILGSIESGSSADRAGLRQGQEIVAVDGDATRTWTDVNMKLFERLGESGDITFTVREAGEWGTTTDYAISITNWLSSDDEPLPMRDLGLSRFVPEIPAIIGQVTNDGSARAAGLKAGDVIKLIDDAEIEDWQHLVEVVQSSPGQPLEFGIEREGRRMTLVIVPESVERDGGRVGLIGAIVAPIEVPEALRREVSYPVYSAWIPAVKRTWDLTVFTLESIGKLIQGAISPKNLSGPITIAQVANMTAQNGFESFIGFIALLSISLGVINLLPVPVLDGGHLLYYLIELVAGRPVPERIQVWGLQIGMFLIVSIMMLAFYNDLTRL